jgi:RNA polymerase sigma-70 factor (ECF subfamily)
LTLLERVLASLGQEYQARGNGDLFEALKGSLAGQDTLPYTQVGLALGMSEPAVKKAAQRLRQRYREVLREQIAATVDDPAEIDDEIRALFAALSG